MKQRIIQRLTLLAAVVLLGTVLFSTRQLIARQANRVHSPTPAIIQHSRVSVTVPVVGSYRATVEGYGEATPHFSLTLSAKTTGTVLSLAELLEPGHRVKKGDLLVQLDPTEYEAALADAEADLASARLELLEAEREATQARVEWEQSGFSGEPDSELVLHEPQLESARAAYSRAEKNVQKAREDLDNTRITAPFDAIVVERKTGPGSYLQKGSEVATLYSTDRMEIEIPLAASDWKNLPSPATLLEQDWPVLLTGVENGQEWHGRIIRAELHVNQTSRLRSLVVAVDTPLSDPQNPLLPGTFVKATIQGQEQSNLWQLPATALSQRGEVWYLTENRTLAKFSATAAFTHDGHVYIHPPRELEARPVQVVTQPLSSYLPGMTVIPTLEDNNGS